MLKLIALTLVMSPYAFAYEQKCPDGGKVVQKTLSTTCYLNGMKHGPSVIWYKPKKPKQINTFVNDVRIKSTEFWEDGSINVDRELNKDGRNHGHYVSYYQNGKKEMEGTYNDGDPVGELKTWDKAGNPLKVETDAERAHAKTQAKFNELNNVICDCEGMKIRATDSMENEKKITEVSGQVNKNKMYKLGASIVEYDKIIEGAKKELSAKGGTYIKCENPTSKKRLGEDCQSYSWQKQLGQK